MTSKLHSQMLCANLCTYRSVSVSVCTVRVPLFSGGPGWVENPVRLTTYSTDMELRVCGSRALPYRADGKKLEPRLAGILSPPSGCSYSLWLTSKASVSHNAYWSFTFPGPRSPSPVQHPNPLMTCQKDRAEKDHTSFSKLCSPFPLPSFLQFLSIHCFLEPQLWRWNLYPRFYFS